MKIIGGDSPEKDGMYVVYEDVYVPYARRVFLTYINETWSYPSSDQKFRGVIVGYIGPMPCPLISELTAMPVIKYAVSKMPEGMHGCFKDGPIDSVKELTELHGDEGDFIFKLHLDKEAEIIGKWSDKKNKWLRKI